MIDTKSKCNLWTKFTRNRSHMKINFIVIQTDFLLRSNFKNYDGPYT